MCIDLELWHGSWSKHHGLRYEPRSEHLGLGKNHWSSLRRPWPSTRAWALKQASWLRTNKDHSSLILCTFFIMSLKKATDILTTIVKCSHAFEIRGAQVLIILSPFSDLNMRGNPTFTLVWAKYWGACPPWPILRQHPWKTNGKWTNICEIP